VAVPLRLVEVQIAGDPVLDTAVASALLAEVIDGAPAVVRVSRPEPLVSFGRLDRLAAGFATALEVALGHGFTPVMRVGGGRAAAVHGGAIQLGIGEPAAESATERFVATADLVRSALGRLGVSVEVGELPGEFCAGAWSLHAGGIKLSGIAQRVTRGAAWTEAFVMVSGGARMRAVLVSVYEALGLQLDPRTVGSLEDLLPGISWEAASSALRAELAARRVLVPPRPDAGLPARAAALRSRHVAEPRRVRGRKGEPFRARRR
jgi:octanoyl-[GcvH]:protein N-octanoyltransferase